METIRYSTTETAKLIRKELKEKFPTIKFSVRSDIYSGGSSINVYFSAPRNEEGFALRAEINKIIKTFQGATFDGMTDMKDYITQEKNGQIIRYGVDFVFANLTWEEVA